MSQLPLNWTVGTAALGHGGERSPHVLHPERCADYGHPGVTYNPWHDVTACLCGKRWQEGKRIQWPKADECGGPLSECTERCPYRT